MPFAKAVGTACLFIIPVLATAQFSGQGEFPGFRNISALPGSGFGVTSDGRAGFKGAMAYSTPVAYSLAPWEFVAGGGYASHDWGLAFPDQGGFGSRKGNGTGQIQGGLPIPRWGAISYGVLFKSTHGDNAGAVQWTPPQRGPVKFAVGIQDVHGRGGASGFGLPGDRDFTRSIYVVGTWEADPKTHVTMGYGDGHRFRGVFGSASYDVLPRLKVAGEYDTFNWNWVAMYDLGSIYKPLYRDRRPVQLLAFVGQLAGRYGVWGVNVRF